MKVNVSNMPLNTLYKIDDNRYVIALMLNESRKGHYKCNQPTRFTEIYKVDDSGFMIRMVSGTLVDNPKVYDFDNLFAIHDYDNEGNYSFKVALPLKEIDLEELYKLRDTINNSVQNKK